MIGQLCGTILIKKPPMVLINVAGIGYEVFAPMSTFYRLPDSQQQVQLLTHLIVREDLLQLYGFLQSEERDLFRTLIKVNGIGPKAALSILSGISVSELVACLQSNDWARLTCIPGIGPKTAQRMTLELAPLLAQWEWASQTTSSTELEQTYLQEAIDALMALGYKATEARQAIKKVYNPQLQSSCEELIRLALQQRMVG